RRPSVPAMRRLRRNCASRSRADLKVTQSLLEEYRRQLRWRDWERALAHCPPAKGQSVLDLGCGSGDVAGLMAERRARVTGIDGNAALRRAAKDAYPACRFELQDLRDLDLPPRSFDGLWSSFAPAYFTDFAATLAHWCSFLKQAAWVCLVDIDDLFAHMP